MKTPLSFLAILLATASVVSAEIPQQLNYQGRVSVQGVNFNGNGQFKFALVDSGINQNLTATAISMAAGSVNFIFVQNGGSGYTEPPVITIAPPEEAGVQATATAIVDGGVVTSITITEAGSGYIAQPVVTIAAPPPDFLYNSYWSNDGSSTLGTEPGNFVPLQVTQGLYSVRLGDASLTGMTEPITPGTLASGNVSLRIWFNDGTNGFQLLTPDQPLASSAFAIVAGTAAHATSADTALSVPDGSITAAKLAPGATGTDLPAGAIQLMDLPHTSSSLLSPGWSAIPISPVTLINDQWSQHLNPQSTPVFNIDTYGRKTHVSVWSGTDFITFGARLNTDQGADWYADGGRLPINQAGQPSWSAMGFSNAPVARWHAAGVWTGSRMLVWGGERQDEYGEMIYGDGGSYSPPTNSWESLPSSGAPSARSQATAVWSGSEMIVWGGRSQAHYPLNTSGWLGNGARYNPSTASWSPISSVNAPTARGLHQAVWTGSEMIIFGGYGSGGVANGHAAYQPATDTWRTLSNAAAPGGRAFHTAVWTGREMIVWGGFNFTAIPALDDGGIYDPATDQWRGMSQIIPNTDYSPEIRKLHTAVWTGREMIVWGGYGGTDFSPFANLNNGYAYRPDTNTWRSLILNPSTPGARLGPDSVWSGTRMLIFAGFQSGYFTSSVSSFFLPGRTGYYYIKN